MFLERAGDSNAITRRYMDSILIDQRNLNGDIPDTRFEIFGRSFETPVTTAALSHLKTPREDGMVELAQAARLAGALMFCGMGTPQQLDAVMAAGAQVVKIIKPYADEEQIYRRIAHARACGCLAVGMDIDHSFDHKGEYDVVQGEKMQPVTREKLKAFMAAGPLPFIVKGVLSLTDALICRDLGAAGIVVSHHHGIMDFAQPPLKVLPAIRDKVGKDIKIFVDCGIESGADVYKAMALGADAVSVGRALMPALTRDGPQACADVIRRLTQELKYFMAHTATGDLKSFDKTTIIAP
ncbi:MAG: alpha-hydroxy acid oxidase [Eubacteriales bacterium]|jgi:isopentenyl diphosphate isomerase/L-lactate dehydrogenase-like FMN-dependent dehydrogenase|nr:alpha-hydroxy acid oxidase [Eubacteriales bacterium]